MNFNKHEFNTRVANALSFESDEEKLQFETEMLQLDLMHEVKILMDSQGINKTELANALGVSKGYVSQLFTADKMLNLQMIAKLQRVFGQKFQARFIPKSLKYQQNDTSSMVAEP